MSKLETYRIPLPAHTKLAHRTASSSTEASEGHATSAPYEGHDDPDGGFFYIRDFITEEEERLLLEKVSFARFENESLIFSIGSTNLTSIPSLPFLLPTRFEEHHFQNGGLYRIEGYSIGEVKCQKMGFSFLNLYQPL